mmetsp:Transcript_39963/g.96471  ORF Transcript_39963/g.96471 Transcript_39963/m.96471 type:complete len:708 (+) Transcript_39963:49-2172(+)
MKPLRNNSLLSVLFFLLLLSSSCDSFLLPSWKLSSMSSSSSSASVSSFLQVPAPAPMCCIIRQQQRLKHNVRKPSSLFVGSSTAASSTAAKDVVHRDEQMTSPSTVDDDDSSLTKSQKRRKKRRNLYSPKDRVDGLDWVVVEEYCIPEDGIDFSTMALLDDSLVERFERLEITPRNMTVAVALHLLDPERFPTLSKARKACRQGKIALVVQNDDDDDDDHVGDDIGYGGIKDLGQNPQGQQLPQRRRALVSDRVGPFDKIHRKETRSMLTRQRDLRDDDAPGGSQPTMSTNSTSNDQYDVCSLVAPYFQLQVVYEDDYMAIVNKPAGVLVHPESGKGRNNILYALPYVLRKPSRERIVCDNSDDDDGDDDEVLDHPIPVHRLDFVTSGLLVVGKTKNSVRRLSQQFEYRKAHKTYTAMVWGVPTPTKEKVEGQQNQQEEEEDRIPPSLLRGDENSDAKDWNLADSTMDGKNCRTWWRIIKTYQYDLPIDDDQNTKDTEAETVLDPPPSSSFLRVPISLVDLKPETGRYHQLRRQMAWLYNTPMCGDPIYVNSTTTLGDSDNGNSDNIIASSAAETVTAAISLSGNRRYHRGLMLCSNRIRLEHPFYNTPIGRNEWNTHKDVIGGQRSATTVENNNDKVSSQLYEVPVSTTGSNSNTEEEKDDNHTVKKEIVVVVDACIPVPKKFDKFQQLLQRMSDRGEGKEEGGVV